MTTAIVLSADTAGLAVIRSLGSHGVPVIVVYYQAREMGYVSKYVSRAVQAPHPGIHESEFIDLLISLARDEGGGLVIATDDATLIAVSRQKEKLQQYCEVACTDWSITRQFIDKKYTHVLAESVGVPIPKTFAPEAGADVKGWSQTVGFPIIVKPRQSHQYAERFGKKCTRANDIGELVAACNQAVDASIGVILQEFIPGDDTHSVNYNSYFVSGEPLVEFTSMKVRQSPPLFGLPRVVVSQKVPEVMEPARKFLSALGFYGFSCTEFKRDPRDGIYKMMEVNGRHNRSASLAVRCGSDFPRVEYDFLTSGLVPNHDEFAEGVYWIDEFRDAIDWIRYRGHEQYKFLDYLKPYMRRHIFASFAFTDPKPFFKRLFAALRLAAGGREH